MHIGMPDSSAVVALILAVVALLIAFAPGTHRKPAPPGVDDVSASDGQASMGWFALSLLFIGSAIRLWNG